MGKSINSLESQAKFSTVDVEYFYEKKVVKKTAVKKQATNEDIVQH